MGQTIVTLGNGFDPDDAQNDPDLKTLRDKLAGWVRFIDGTAPTLDGK